MNKKKLKAIVEAIDTIATNRTLLVLEELNMTTDIGLSKYGEKRPKVLKDELETAKQIISAFLGELADNGHDNE